MAGAVLSAGRDRSVRRRHPWIFSGAVRAVSGNPRPGETVSVTSAEGEGLGWGSYSPESQIRIRMLSFDPSQYPDPTFIRSLVSAAVARRVDMMRGRPADAYRLIHGESDSLPGVTADLYGGWIVTQFASAGAEAMKETVVRALVDCVPGCLGVYNRSDVDARAREGLPTEGPSAKGVLAGGEPPERVEVREGGVRYLVDVRAGHKTGFYLDQRDARAAVAKYASGRDVLNCFSYTGGFGVACAASGAAHVENLDLSRPALDLARENFRLNGIEDDRAEFVCADVFRQLRLYRDKGRKFGLIVLDPPKFADSRGHLMRAMRGYKDINLLAMKLLAPGGILATFSCSGAVTPELFAKVCSDAALDSGRDFRILERTSQATDHPVPLSFPEGLYLKGLVLQAG